MMVKKAAVILIALGMAGHVSAQVPDFLARFDGGIGVIPVSNGAGPVNPDGTFPNVKLNIVRGVNPGAGPWTIADLRAEVQTDGRIRVRGRGLLLASSNSIGQNANSDSERWWRVVRGRHSKARRRLVAAGGRKRVGFLPHLTARPIVNGTMVDANGLDGWTLI